VARLEPGDFHPEVGWYHIPEVDALAHLIYPHVREGIDSGRMIDEDFIAACVRVYEEWDERRRHPPIGPER